MKIPNSIYQYGQPVFCTWHEAECGITEATITGINYDHRKSGTTPSYTITEADGSQTDEIDEDMLSLRSIAPEKATAATPETQTLYETPYIALKTRGRWAYATRIKGHGAVGIIALTPENKIVLVEQFRIPHNCQVIELPAGLIGDNCVETPLEAAKKELLEETGYIAQNLCAFGNPVSSSAGLSDETIQLFVATGLTKVATGGGVESENITVHEIPLAELFTWLITQQAAGKITDPKTMAIPGILQHLGITHG